MTYRKNVVGVDPQLYQLTLNYSPKFDRARALNTNGKCRPAILHGLLSHEYCDFCTTKHRLYCCVETEPFLFQFCVRFRCRISTLKGSLFFYDCHPLQFAIGSSRYNDLTVSRYVQARRENAGRTDKCGRLVTIHVKYADCQCR